MNRTSAAPDRPMISAVNPIELPPQWRGWKSGDAEAEEEGREDTSPATESETTRAFLDYEPEPKEGIPPVWEFPANDDGRASFFLKHFGDIVRYVPENANWRIWHGHRWHSDSTGRMGYFCQILSRSQLVAAQRLLEDLTGKLTAEITGAAGVNDGIKLKRSDVEKLHAAAKRQAEALGNEKIISTLLEAASRQAAVIVPLGQWDADPHLVGTQNGTLDLRTGIHSPGSPQDYITKALATAYEPSATAPRWKAFINRILPDRELAEYIQTLVGYSLSGSTDDQGFYFLYGSGKNGKSVFIETLAGLFGDYAGKARRNLIEEPRNGGDCKHDIAQLPGLRFLHGEETSSGGRLREDVLKGLTGSDTLKGEAKYAEPFEFIPKGKLWLAGNHKPRVDGVDEGIWRRVRLIPFIVSIRDDEEIPSSVLLARFRKERPGILNWALSGAMSRSTGKIPMPAVVREAVADYRQSEDDMAEFIEECTQAAAADYKETKQAVFAAYQKWARQSGIAYPWTAKQFTRRLGEKAGWQLDPGRRAWVGKSVRSDYLNN